MSAEETKNEAAEMGEKPKRPKKRKLPKVRRRELDGLGVPQGPLRGVTMKALRDAFETGASKEDALGELSHVLDSPDAFLADTRWSELAQNVHAIQERERSNPPFEERSEPAPFERWGNLVDEASIRQMEDACRLPVAVRGAVMPDAHLGYGLPIGGVLATEGAVIPYAVGVDIACRMKLTVLDLPMGAIEKKEKALTKALERETRFGIGASFETPREHEVMDRDWNVTAITSKSKDKAWRQLGTSGSGNHFVEFGELHVKVAVRGLEPGSYLALLSHSGSRGAGAAVANEYSRLAAKLNPSLPKGLSRLAWLDLDREAGQEYWAAMELMGAYAEANHACIHAHIAERLGAEVLLDVENHHNFAWKEVHDGRELIVHRKGATPAGEGVLGVIPGSMADSAFVVRGRGSAASLDSASHGAGRKMSRTQAKQRFDWRRVNEYLARKRVKLLSAGLDEVPMAYKDIHQVMEEQSDLVEPLAEFLPRIVKMAPAGERPED